MKKDKKGDWKYWIPMIGPFFVIPGEKNLSQTNLTCAVYHMVSAGVIIATVLLSAPMWMS